MKMKSGGVSEISMIFVSFASILVLLCLSSTDLAADNLVFSFEVVETEILAGRFSTIDNQGIIVDWGDGTQSEFSGTEQRFSKEFAEPFNTEVKIYASGEEDTENILKMIRLDRGNFGFGLKTLPAGLSSLHCTGNNTVYGNVSEIPEGMTYFRLRGNNTVTGNISDMPDSMAIFSCWGRNTLTGDVADLPDDLTYIRLRGNNTVGGDIGNLPDSLTFFFADGRNTVTGDIAGLPKNLTDFACWGDNTVTGNIGDLPDSLTSFTCFGNNTVTGNIENLHEGLVAFYCLGENTVTGDIADLPSGLNFFDCRGLNKISDYTPGRNWADGLTRIRIEPASGYGLSSEEVDGLLIDLSKAKWRESDIYYIRLDGGNAPRTNASDDAVAALEEMGISVTTN